MPIEDFADMLKADITIEPFSSADGYGAPTYGTAVSYKGRVSERRRWMRRADGTEVVAMGEVWLKSNVQVGIRDRVTLPDGRTPVILDIARPQDETGAYHHTKIVFG